MTIQDIILLSQKKRTTIEHICKKLYETVREFEKEREDFYLQEFKEQALLQPSAYSLNNINQYVGEMVGKIQLDVREYAKRYSSGLVDDLLDAINEGQIEKNAGKVFLVVASALGSFERP